MREPACAQFPNSANNVGKSEQGASWTYMQTALVPALQTPPAIMFKTRFFIVGFVATLSLGCSVQAYPDTPVSESPEISVMLKNQAYRGNGFVQMNTVPYDSDLAPGSKVMCYVSKEAALSYAGIVPDLKTALTGDFPVGGIVVREVTDAAGEVQKLTVMVREQHGYYPDVGDFFFGVTDTEGKPMADANGQVQWGRLPTCAGCHMKRSGAEYLFGVREKDRLAH
jgi:hypothetical protein